MRNTEQLAQLPHAAAASASAAAAGRRADWAVVTAKRRQKQQQFRLSLSLSLQNCPKETALFPFFVQPRSRRRRPLYDRVRYRVRDYRVWEIFEGRRTACMRIAFLEAAKNPPSSSDYRHLCIARPASTPGTDGDGWQHSSNSRCCWNHVGLGLLDWRRGNSPAGWLAHLFPAPSSRYLRR